MAPSDRGLAFPDTSGNPDLPADMKRDAGPTLTPLAIDDGRLWVGVSAAAPLRLWTWIGASSSWTEEVVLPQVGGPVAWAINQVPGASGHEAVLLKADHSGTPALELHRWSGSSWQAELSIPGAGTKLELRDVDLATEGASGHLLLVYGDGTSRPVFQTYTGAWSVPAAVPLNDGSGPYPDPTSGAVRWVELVPRGGTDEVALLFADSDNKLGVIVWDGNAWDTASAQQLTDDLKTNPNTQEVSQRVFDGAYETGSGDLLVSWGYNGGPGFRYRHRSAGAWTNTATVKAPSSGKTDFVDLQSDPASDKIALVALDLGDGIERLGLATWNGSSWEGAAEYDSQIRDVNDKAEGDFPAAVAWAGQSGKALCVFPDNASGKIDWYSWTSGSWKAGSDVTVASKGNTESVLLRGYANQAKVLLVLSDDKAQIFSAVFDGSVDQWTQVQPAPLATKLAYPDTVPFALDLKR